MTSQLPDDAVAPAALVIHRAHCGGSCRHEPREGSNDWVTARKALSAALPALTGAIAAQATAAERERIMAVVRDVAARWRDHSIKAPDAEVAAEYGYIAAIIDKLGDVLGGTADGAHTPGGAT